MRVFISADMEGVWGVATDEDVTKSEPEYETAVERMVGDVNAAIDGAREAGAGVVVVNDSHSTMRNLEPEALRERARLIRGSAKPRSMMQGLEAGHDVAFFVGYHAMAGTAEAVLNHSYYSSDLVSLSVDGREVGELGCNAGLARALGVPVGLVTGDDETAREATDELEGVETAVVKEGVSRFSANFRPLETARAAIRESAATAVERARDGEFSQGEAPAPLIDVQWATTNLAQAATRVAGVDRVDGRTIRIERDSYPEAYETMIAAIRSAAAGRSKHFG